jgi:PAS domain S-box-containing protein
VPYRSVTHAGVTLLCFPPYDQVLARLAGQRLDGLVDPTPEALQASLRTTYPQVVIRPRESIAALGGGTAWYVYRDGRYSPFGDDGPWWETPGVARIEIDAEGRYIGANAAALELIGVDLATLRGMRTGDLTVPATRPTVAWFWQLLEDVGELHSTSILATPDGREVPVEYRLVRGSAPDDVSVSYMRAIPAEAAEPSAPVERPED